MSPHKVRCFKYKFVVDISEALVGAIEKPIKISVFKAKFISITLQKHSKMDRKILYITYAVHCHCAQSQGGVINSKYLDFNDFFSTFRLQ